MGLRRVETVTWQVDCDGVGCHTSTGAQTSEVDARGNAVAIGIERVFPKPGHLQWLCRSCRMKVVG